MEDEEQRKAYQIKEGYEEQIPFSNIKKGMHIRLFEPSGVEVEHKGESVFVAASDAFVNELGVLSFEVEEP